MFITPSFKKRLIVEQFQGNYLKLFLFRYVEHYGIIMHTSFLPTGQLFLDIVPSSFPDITRALRGCFRRGSNLQRYGDLYNNPSYSRILIGSCL